MQMKTKIPLKKITCQAIIILLIFAASSGVAVLAFIMLSQQPIQRFTHPAYPFVHRYTANASWTRDTYGDLAGMTGNPEYRVIRSITATTDSWGFMNKVGGEVSPSTDVLALGDSYTAGSPIDQSKMWPNRLAELSKLSVYNLGHPAEGPWQQLMNFQIERQRLHLNNNSRLVWAFFSGNDLDDYYGDALILPPPIDYNWKDKLRRFLALSWRYSPIGRWVKHRNEQKNSIQKRVAERNLPDGRTVLFLKAYAERAKRTQQEIRAHPHYEHLRSTIEKMHSICLKDGISLIIVFFPSKPEIYGWLYENLSPWSTKIVQSAFSIAVQDITKSLEIPFFDTTLSLSREARTLYDNEKKLIYWEDDTHFNEYGYQIAAEMISDALDSRIGTRAVLKRE